MLRREFVLGAALGLAPLGRVTATTASATAITRDRAGRILIGVHIDDRGPFRFMLDTGASISAISGFLARELRLPAAIEDDGHRGDGGRDGSDANGQRQPRQLLGSTGSAPLLNVQAHNLVVDRWQFARPVLALLPETAGFQDTDGVLGSDLLQGARLDLSLVDARAVFAPPELAGGPGSGGRTSALAAPPSRTPQAGLREVAIARRLGPLLALRGRLGRVELCAILDTGAQRSIGNLALARALRLDDATAAAAVVRGADGQSLAARQLDTPALRLGATTLAAQPLLYADLPVFARWGWQDQPALLLGMDLLGRLSRLQVDYPHQRVSIALAAS